MNGTRDLVITNIALTYDLNNEWMTYDLKNEWVTYNLKNEWLQQVNYYQRAL
jgi:ubiquinone/menaquinone biosynthesis C-methylase UbiE